MNCYQVAAQLVAIFFKLFHPSNNILTNVIYLATELPFQNGYRIELRRCAFFARIFNRQDVGEHEAAAGAEPARHEVSSHRGLHGRAG